MSTAYSIQYFCLALLYHCLILAVVPEFCWQNNAPFTLLKMKWCFLKAMRLFTIFLCIQHRLLVLHIHAFVTLLPLSQPSFCSHTHICCCPGLDLLNDYSTLLVTLRAYYKMKSHILEPLGKILFFWSLWIKLLHLFQFEVRARNCRSVDWNQGLGQSLHCFTVRG